MRRLVRPVLLSKAGCELLTHDFGGLLLIEPGNLGDGDKAKYNHGNHKEEVDHENDTSHRVKYPAVRSAQTLLPK
jgi:hypothetical protein